MSTPTRLAALVLAAALVLPTAGCGGKKAKGDVPYVARDVSTLYTLAHNQLRRKRYREAAKAFDEVERQHPYSVWARRAQMMSAYSYFKGRQYNEATSSAQRFLTIHPGNRDAPYAQYIIAMSYYQQMADISRDQRITQQAADAFGELIRRYPQSRYAADGRQKLALINDHLAGKEMEVGRFYQRQGNWLASVVRFRTVTDKYAQTNHAAEALMRLTESYLALGIPEEARKAAALLGQKYPDSVWYRHAAQLIQRHAPSPA